jgi:hypothetical protein
MARYSPVSFDLVVWAMDAGATADDVGAAYELCRQGEHVDGDRDPRVAAFHRELTSVWSDADGPGYSPWAVRPLHVAGDHVELNLTDDAADEVLLEIERLAGEHGLFLLDPQGDTVYPPRATAR